MLVKRQKQMSFYDALYEKIPEDHLLRLIDKAVDFGFVNELLSDSYCKSFGRPAKEPEMMLKLLLLQRLYDLSDVRVIEEASLNLAFLWFLRLSPEEALPDASLLAKFRTQRLKDGDLDEMITQTVRQCVEAGILKNIDIGVDATHILANTKKKVPERVMKHLAKKILAALKEDNEGVLPDRIDENIPDYKNIDDHKKAKEVMRAYLKGLMDGAEPFAKEHTIKALAEAGEILADEKFMSQKGIRSLVDKDARVGAKSKTDSFFGYKAEVAMELDERIITAVKVHSGEYADGTDFKVLLDKTLEGVGETSCIMGDKAYFRRDILDVAKEIGAKTYIPVSASAYRIDEALFSYNKDSDEWSCARGNATVSLRRIKRKRGNRDYEVLAYRFSKEQCMACTKRAECMGKAKGARELHVSVSAALFYEESARQKDPAFLERYKKRAAIEWKNAELKCHHGMARAKGYGLGSVSMQVKLTALAVNCKRMATIVARKASEAIKSAALAPSSLGAAAFMSLWHLKGRLLGLSATYRPFCLHFGH
jgi:transposase